MKTPLSLRREQHLHALEGELANLVRQLRAVPAVRKVILFGSYASGRRDLFTDLDIMVVMDSALGFVERNASLAHQIRGGIPVDLLAYTAEEMERMRDRPFMRQALATGKVLYAR